MTQPVIPINPIVLNTIVERLPLSLLPSHELDPQCNPLADENYAIPSSIDMLLGADVYPYILRDTSSAPSKGQPFTLNTILRFVLIGPVQGICSSMACASLLTTLPRLDSLLKRFWEIEEVAEISVPSEEEIFVENHFQTTVSRTPSGRYMVSYPVKPHAPLNKLDNRAIATANLSNLTSRLNRKPEVKTAYIAFLDEYHRLGHMLVSDNF